MPIKPLDQTARGRGVIGRCLAGRRDRDLLCRRSIGERRPQCGAVDSDPLDIAREQTLIGRRRKQRKLDARRAAIDRKHVSWHGLWQARNRFTFRASPRGPATRTASVASRGRLFTPKRK